ncbi:MAG: twin-arginine translocation signal domain-containing protein [Isosphaeraceae bacterium]
MSIPPALPTRRDLLKLGAALAAGASLGPVVPSRAQEPGVRPPRRPAGVEVLNPRGRVPVSLIIDDSTCLVNLAHFAIPQFAQVFPTQYRQDWQALPREIPDRFVRKFADWCRERGIKGKYSIVPYPACVGWLDRDLPGWSRQALDASLSLVRSEIIPDWDIHPEMVSHTWVVDTRTGRPFPERSDRFMENWRWTDGKSADQVADYMAYALRILKNVGLPCEGITTPGGFGNRVLPQLAQATLQSVRDVFNAEIPHYFRHLFTDDRSVAPRVEYASGLDGPDPRCVVSIIGCTGDWFGGWDGLTPGRVDQFITADGRGGRLPEVIARGEPAILVGHWPGFYFNGEETGFKIFQGAVARLEAHFDNLVWMKLSAIARYWAARELTRIETTSPSTATLVAPFATPDFTIRLPIGSDRSGSVVLESAGTRVELKPVRSVQQLASGTVVREPAALTACFALPKGTSTLKVG